MCVFFHPNFECKWAFILLFLSSVFLFCPFFFLLPDCCISLYLFYPANLHIFLFYFYFHITLISGVTLAPNWHLLLVWELRVSDTCFWWDSYFWLTPFVGVRVISVTGTCSNPHLLLVMRAICNLHWLVVWQLPVAPAPQSLSPWWAPLPPAFSPKPPSSPAQGPILCTHRPRLSPLPRLAWSSHSWGLAFPYALVSHVDLVMVVMIMMMMMMTVTEMIIGCARYR